MKTKKSAAVTAAVNAETEKALAKHAANLAKAEALVAEIGVEAALYAISVIAKRRVSALSNDPNARMALFLQADRVQDAACDLGRAFDAFETAKAVGS